jgi:hypothetical protein
MTAFFKRLPLLLLCGLACLAAGPVYADCTSPAGNERDIIYNNGFHTYQFCNGTNWMPFGAIGGGGGGGLTLISTQTASSSASLQWTGLGAYGTYFLHCHGMHPVTNGGNFGAQFGEGATPTWETGSSYWGAVGSNPNSYIALDNGGQSSSTQGQEVELWIYDLSALNAHGAAGIGYNTTAAAVQKWQVIGAQYFGDTNAITALRVLYPSGGNIASGTCSLYWMN